MVNIAVLELNSESNSINLQATTASGNQIVGLRFWDKDSYGDDTLGVDLSSLLSGVSASENIDILASDVNLESFSGVFYFKVTSNEDPQINNPVGAVANLNKYYECLLKQVIYTEDLDCTTCNNEIFSLDTLLSGVQYGLSLGLFAEVNEMISTLNTLCFSCSACDSFNTILGGYSFGTYDNIIKLKGCL